MDEPLHNFEPEDFILYVCPFCGRTIKWPAVSTSSPNTTCGHNGFVYQMKLIYSSKEGN